MKLLFCHQYLKSFIFTTDKTGENRIGHFRKQKKPDPEWCNSSCLQTGVYKLQSIPKYYMVCL